MFCFSLIPSLFPLLPVYHHQYSRFSHYLLYFFTTTFNYILSFNYHDVVLIIISLLNIIIINNTFTFSNITFLAAPLLSLLSITNILYSTNIFQFSIITYFIIANIYSYLINNLFTPLLQL